MVLAGSINGSDKKEAPIIFNKLKLNHDNYFNAGVVMINYEFWKKNSVGDSLIDIMENRGDDLIFLGSRCAKYFLMMNILSFPILLITILLN